MGNWARRFSFGAALVLCTGTFAPCLHAQNTPQLSPDALKELLQSVHDLTSQVHQLSTQLE